MKKTHRVRVAFWLTMLLIVFTVRNAVADVFCVSGAVNYQLETGFADDATVVNGIRLSVMRTPIHGTSFKEPDGTVVYGISEDFDWGSGNWIHPQGTNVIKLSTAGSGTYDTTYHGNRQEATVNVRGVANIIACPSMSAPKPSVDDPNSR